MMIGATLFWGLLLAVLKALKILKVLKVVQGLNLDLKYAKQVHVP